MVPFKIRMERMFVDFEISSLALLLDVSSD